VNLRNSSLIAAAALGLVALAVYGVGLGWGLPSAERFRRVLAPEQKDDRFYEKVEAARRALYARVGPNIQAAYGRGSWDGSVAPAGSEELSLHAYSGFALRSVEQDEQFVFNALSRFKPRRLQFNPHQFLYGGSYLYPLAGWLAALHIARAVRLESDPLYYYRDPGRLGRLYLAGRWFSALSALGCIALIFLIGREAAGDEAGLWAAALFALSPAIVCFAHVLKPHMTAALYALACILFSARWARGASGREPLWAGLFFGLAVGAAKNHCVLALPIALAALAAEGWTFSARGIKRAVAAGLVGVAAFLLSNPYIPFNFRDFLDETRALTAWYKPSLTPGQLISFALGPWRAGLGIPLAALSIGTGVFALARPRSALFTTAILWLSLALGASYIAGGLSPMDVSARFFLAGLGLSSVLVAASLSSLPGRARVAGRALLGLLVAALLARSAALAANFAADAPGRSNAFAAANWVEENLPAGAEIGVRASVAMVDRFPPILFSRYRIVSVEAAADPARLPRYYATNARWLDSMEPAVRARYRVLRVFGGETLTERWAADPFTSANFPIAILELAEAKQ